MSLLTVLPQLPNSSPFARFSSIAASSGPRLRRFSQERGLLELSLVPTNETEMQSYLCF